MSNAFVIAILYYDNSTTKVRKSKRKFSRCGRSARLSSTCQNSAGGAHDAQSFGGCVGKRGEMAHLAPRARLVFAVEVEFDVGRGAGPQPVGCALLPEVAEQIGHRGRTKLFGRTERQPADGAHLLLELTCHTSINCEVAGVMRTRCDLVDEQFLVACEKKFDAEDADNVELFEYAPSDLGRLPHNCGRDMGGRD